MKHVYIAEKPSVAKAFAQVLGIRGSAGNGYLESEEAIVTWCVGHLVTMSYPEVYDAALKKWSLAPLPFIPQAFRYEVLPAVQKQFRIVSSILNRGDVDVIYVCTDAGREGEYIYRLVEQQAGVKGKERKRVWIDSQTDEEIRRGIEKAKDLSEYDNLSAAAYLRAKEDYLMGINFSRALTLRYGFSIKNYLNLDRCVIAVGRVMTCVLGIVVDREREIRHFTKTPYYGLEADLTTASPVANPSQEEKARMLTTQWRVGDESRYANSPLLYNEKGFKDMETAKELEDALKIAVCTLIKTEKKTEKKQAPLLYNLAELQNDCSRFFKISPDQTLAVAQELYEKKLTTYPRTDARVLSSAVAKVIETNIKGLQAFEAVAVYAKSVLQHKAHEGIAKTRYVNDKAVTDHYAIIPTGQGLGALTSLSSLSKAVYECICRRFLAIFYPPAVYEKMALTVSAALKDDRALSDDKRYKEYLYSNYRLLSQKGYLHVLEKMSRKNMQAASAEAGEEQEEEARDKEGTESKGEQGTLVDAAFMEWLKTLRKGEPLTLIDTRIKESETTPPKRYNSGTLILTMENAGQFIEDDDLREQIKGSGIGTSATRAEILKKLVTNGYLALNTKTQIITPTQVGEMIYETVLFSMKPMLSPTLTASWEKGLTGVAEGSISEQEYMDKLEAFIRRRVDSVKAQDYSAGLRTRFDQIAPYYAGAKKASRAGAAKKSTAKKTTERKAASKKITRNYSEQVEAPAAETVKK